MLLILGFLVFAVSMGIAIYSDSAKPLCIGTIIGIFLPLISFWSMVTSPMIEAELQVRVIENIAIVVMNKEVIQVQKEIKESLKDGDIVICKYGRSFDGLQGQKIFSLKKAAEIEN